MGEVATKRINIMYILVLFDLPATCNGMKNNESTFNSMNVAVNNLVLIAITVTCMNCFKAD